MAAVLRWTKSLLLLTLLAGFTSVESQSVPEYIDVHGTLYPVSPDYVAVYVVDFSRGTPNPLTIICNGTTSWSTDNAVFFAGEPYIFDGDTVFGEGNNLEFNGFNSQFIGTYTCAEGSIRIYVTDVNPYVNITSSNPLIVRLGETFDISAVVRATSDGVTVSPSQGGDLTTTISYLSAMQQAQPLVVVNTTDLSPYERVYTVELDIGSLVQTNITVRAEHLLEEIFGESSVQLRIEDVYPPDFPPATVLNVSDSYTLNCTPTISTTSVSWNGPNVGEFISPDGFSVTFSATQSRAGFYTCTVQYSPSIERMTQVYVLPSTLTPALYFVNPEDSYSQPLRDEYILLNSFRNEGSFRFTCLVKYGSLQLFSETDPAITDMFSSITESGQFMVDEAMVAVTRGDSYIEVEFEEGGMYNDTLKCYSEDLSSSVRLHIIAANRYLAVHPSTPRSANLGETINITFVFVEAVGEFFLDLLKDGDVIASSFVDLQQDGQLWYYELTVNSSSGGNYTLDDGIGSASVIFSVIVPTLTIAPQNITLTEGDEITIACTPSLPTLELEWDYPQGASVSFSGELRHNLTIHDASFINSSGVYKCKAAGDAGTIVEPVSTTVDVPPPTLTIAPQNIILTEGDEITIACTPSLPTLELEWDYPEGASASVSISGELMHNLTIHNASSNVEGVYKCKAAGDAGTIVESVTTTVDFLDRCKENYTGGVLWSEEYEGNVSTVRCRDVDRRFSTLVMVTRVCSNGGKWLRPDFSGCTLTSSEQEAFVVFSILAQEVEGDTDIDAVLAEQDVLLEELTNRTTTQGGTKPQGTTLTIFPDLLREFNGNEYILLRFTASYSSTGAQEVNLNRIAEDLLCSSLEVFLENAFIRFQRGLGDYFPFERSDNCECTSSEIIILDEEELLREQRGIPSCSLVHTTFQGLCNGTVSSPCMCTADRECQCQDPYTGDGQLCVLDSDGDSYPAQPLSTCSENDTNSYCLIDTCPSVPNEDPNNSTPCTGFETGVSACPAEVDEVWQIDWPYTRVNEDAVVPCGVDFVGNATRTCISNMMWGEVDVSNCSRVAFVSARQRAAAATEDEDPEAAIDVVEDLADATAPSDVPQFPEDLETANEVVSDVLDILIENLEEGGEDVDSTAVFELLDNVLADNNRGSYATLQESGRAGSEGVLNNVERYALYLAQAMERRGSGQSNMTGINIALRAESVAVQQSEGYAFPSAEELVSLDLSNGSEANIQLPQSLLEARANSNRSVTVASVLFRNIQTFLPVEDPDEFPQSLVISSQVANQGGDGAVDPVLEENPVIINFVFELTEDVSDDEIQCVFWNFGDNTTSLQSTAWSSEELTTVSVTRDGDFVTVQCSSTHLTSFAVLVDVGGAQIEDEALRIVSYVGLAISLACLLLTIIFFLTFGKKLFSAVHNFVHLNLAIALFVGYLTFAVGVELAKDNEIACNAVTALIQYFLLAAFCWMMCEGVMLYLMLVVVFSELSKKWWFFFLLGWGIPIVFVVIGLGAVHDEYGVEDDNGDYKYCWLSSGDGTYAIWTFVAPMLAIIIINTVFLVLVLFSIFKNRAGRSQKVEKGMRVDLVTTVVKASVILLPLLGLTWVFGLFAVNENTAVFAWLFTIFNSLQGLFIFIFHVIRHDRIWGRMKKKYEVYSTSKANKSTASTGAGTARYRGVSSGVSSTADVELKEKHSIAEPEQKVALDGDGKKEEPA